MGIACFGSVFYLRVQNKWKRCRVHFKNQMWKSEIIFMQMNIKLDQSESSFKQLEYLFIANWEKLETLIIQTEEKDFDQ